MDWRDLLHLIPLAMVQRDQAEEMADDMQKSIVAKLVVPMIPLLVTFAVAFGGMKWAIGSLERRMEAGAAQVRDQCFQTDAGIASRLNNVEARQIDGLSRLSGVEALLKEIQSEIRNDEARTRR